MISFIIKLIPALLGFGILVFFHELGHFIAAKLFKIKVEAFSIGWGPKLIGFKRKETTYKISAIPIGGYCKFKDEYVSDEIPGRIREELFRKILTKMSEKEREYLSDLYKKSLPALISSYEFDKYAPKLGEELVDWFKVLYHFNSVEEEYLMDTDKELELSRSGEMAKVIELVEQQVPELIKFNLNREKYDSDKKHIVKVINSVYNVQKLRDPDSFYGVAPHKRLIVAFAGPLMNLILAILFFTLLAAGTYKENYLPNRIVVDQEIVDSPAIKGGLKSGDRIVEINGSEIKDFNMIRKYMFLNADGKPLKVTVERDGRLITNTVTPVWNKSQLMYMLGVTFYLEPVIEDDGTAPVLKSLGLKDGDKIIGIDEDYKDITTVKMQAILSAKKESGELAIIHLEREGRTRDIEFNVSQFYNEVGKDKFYIPYRIPVRLHEGSGPLEAIKDGLTESVDTIRMTYIGLYSMIFRPKQDVSRHVGGPIMIGAVIGSVTVAGFEQGIMEGLAEFLKVISMISLALAFFNLLPLPAVDGGHIVLNTFEIITRRPISMTIIYGINIVGFFLLIGMAIVVAFMDIVRLIPN